MFQNINNFRKRFRFLKKKRFMYTEQSTLVPTYEGGGGGVNHVVVIVW